MLELLEPAESAERERPAGVPESGFWNPSVNQWEVACRTGADGAREGECLRYRSDGSLFSRIRFAAGVEEGPFAIYHPDGRIAREGKFAAGRVDGLVVAYASEDGRGEPLRSCCVPPKAARLDARYRDGDLLVEVFYNREGQAILSDGRPSPPRPASMSELVQFDETRGGWALCSPALDRFWTAEGLLSEEHERIPGGGWMERIFDGEGRIREEQHFGEDRKRAGLFLRRLAPGNPGPFADARVREERGAFELGQAVGTWSFLDADGQVLRTVDRGRAFPAELAIASPAFAPSLEDGWALAGTLIGEGRVREALCAAARATGRDRDRASLARFLDEHLVALKPEIAAELGEALTRTNDADVATILDGLMMGTEPAAVFRAVSSVLPGTSPAAVDLVEASLLLAPERRMTHLTRALIRVQRGDEAGARADAAVVEADSPGAAASLLSYMDVVFRRFDFSAGREKLVAAGEGDMPVAVGQSLEAIRQLARVYATRLSRTRGTVRAILGASVDPAWVPPDLSALLPNGPVTLRRETIACEPEEVGGEPEVIELDEEIATEGLGVPALLGLAQADHTALGWLCWSAGLDHVALPDAIEPPEALPAAMKTVVQRYWRAHDRLTTGGLLALTNQVPGFEWQGLDIDLVPAHLVQVITAEYLAVRSMFLWLVSAETLSPFQDDVRDA